MRWASSSSAARPSIANSIRFIGFGGGLEQRQLQRPLLAGAVRRPHRPAALPQAPLETGALAVRGGRFPTFHVARS